MSSHPDENWFMAGPVTVGELGVRYKGGFFCCMSKLGWSLFTTAQTTPPTASTSPGSADVHRQEQREGP